ncbi:MAG: hypothetical protein IPP10_18085 [Candidatus Competibacteraceae bacterium]|nr:hypothetical protein [Candidatus Competibacteraceae bacterium]MBK7985263.1 hypothetical protein [Candidatus Competibacteraceae bacterium]MBK8895661.1 hypothetical protein [Candidatus Competibacteraceae bacterium]MBK8962753.1 hypothetical protein [Candidatus Competibacteraceae bacterium]MBK9953315.1 hypothetical protein [Candidatus Competibacteraceae bacterium]
MSDTLGLKQRWQRFAAVPPGQRFRAHFKQRQQHQPSAFHQKILAIGAGILIMGLGVVMLVAPGPGIVVLIIGAMLVAQESLAAARFMDWADLRLRRLLIRGLRVWRRFSAPPSR